MQTTTGNSAGSKMATSVGAFLLSVLFAAGTALAGVGGSVVPSFPGTPVNVGDFFNAQLILTNDSDSPNTAETISATALITPSCGSGVATCAVPDLGVFQLPATATGNALSSCDGVT